MKRFSHKLFHDHEGLSDEDMKEKLKEMLEEDTLCAAKLDGLRKRGVSYDKLWNENLYAYVSILLVLINTFIIIYYHLFINVHLFYRFFLGIMLKKAIIFVALRKIYGRRLGCTKSSHMKKLSQENR